MIELRNISIANDPHRPLLTGASLTLRPGTLTALIGRNGCGKSTLLRVICGRQKPLKGTVNIRGLNPAKATEAELARRVAVVTTEAVRVRNLTCRELVSLGRSPHTGIFGRLSREDERAVDLALRSTGMQDFAGRQVTQMSDGETRRVMLACALAQETEVIVLDEPTSFLDVPGRREVCELLGRLAHEQGKTILFSTHEIEPALKCVDSILVIDGGRAKMLAPERINEVEWYRQ